MNLKGSKTELNLLKAFGGESEARNRYTFYANKAKSDGFEQIAGIFKQTADNEQEHAEIWFKELGGIKGTLENLFQAAAGEHYEWAEMYKEFAKVAKEEGFAKLAEKFELVGNIEKTHEERYLTLAENVKTDKVFKKDEVVTWHCRNCGHTFSGKEAPEVCPTCSHAKAYFEVMGSIK